MSHMVPVLPKRSVGLQQVWPHLFGDATTEGYNGNASRTGLSRFSADANGATESPGVRVWLQGRLGKQQDWKFLCRQLGKYMERSYLLCY